MHWKYTDLSSDSRIGFLDLVLYLHAEVKALCGVYQKLILIPRPDYSSRFSLWRRLIPKAGARLMASLDLSSLAKVSDGYTGGHIATACKEVLTDRRVAQLNRRPLAAAEFVPSLAKIDPVYREEEEAFKTWYEKTPMGKKRLKALRGGDDDDGGKKGKKGKGKKGKGKKKKK
eukprot:m.23658 g.23658  ORF g.23658 m.23658 type:complete len:173 (+) comp28513_c0_seq2:2470-2988(+)